jgi:hypothetical protein
MEFVAKSSYKSAIGYNPIAMKALRWIVLLLLLAQLPFAWTLWHSWQVRRYVSAMAEQRQETPHPFRDLRGGMHIHSAAGGHSLGTYPEIISAARQVGYHYLFITEHPRPQALFRPLDDPELLILYGHEIPIDTDTRVLVLEEPEFRVLSEWRGPSLPLEYDAWELFNLHESAESRDSWFNRINFLYHKVFLPEFFFFHLWEINPRRVRLWDESSRERILTAVGGSDAHRNVGLILTTADGKHRLSFLLDPYEESFQAVTTHVMLPAGEALTTASLIEALKRGSAYIAFEKIGDPTGFSFYAEQGGAAFGMGSRVPPGAQLLFQSPVPARFELRRDGRSFRSLEGRRGMFPADQPGLYRVEVHPLNPPRLLRGKPWIISNPIEVTG